MKYIIMMIVLHCAKAKRLTEKENMWDKIFVESSSQSFTSEY